MAHRIDGRKLSRKQGPRLALYKNLTVSVLRYERVQTTEAKAKEIRGRVEQHDHARQARRPRGPPGGRRRSSRTSRSSSTKLFDEIAPKYADRTSGLHPDRADRPAQGRRRRDRPDRAGLASHPSTTRREGRAGALPRDGRIRRHGLRRVPGSTAWKPGRSRENSRPRWPASTGGAPARSTGPAAPTPGSTPRDR